MFPTSNYRTVQYKGTALGYLQVLTSAKSIWVLKRGRRVIWDRTKLPLSPDIGLYVFIAAVKAEFPQLQLQNCESYTPVTERSSEAGAKVRQTTVHCAGQLETPQLWPWRQPNSPLYGIFFPLSQIPQSSARLPPL